MDIFNLKSYEVLEQIETDRLLLRRTEEGHGDLNLFKQLYRELGAECHLGVYDKDVETDRGVRYNAQRALFMCNHDWDFKKHGVYVVSDKETQDFVGVVGYSFGDTERSDIGWSILPAYQGRGYAKEAAAAVLNIGLSAGMPAVHSHIKQGNAASISVARSLGMDATNRVRQGDGAILYEVTND